MRIGIDAKWYFDGPPSGRVVVRNLIIQIAKINSEHTLVIFLDKKRRSESILTGIQNIEREYIWAGINILSNTLVLPLAVKKAKIDLMIFQNFPSWWGKFLKISFIYDILFLSHPQYFTWKERLYLYPLKFLNNRSDLICTISKSEQQRLRQFGFLAPSIVIYPAVDTNFRPRDKHSKDELDRVITQYNLPEKYLLFVGRLNIRKNIENLLKALVFVKSSIQLVVVGRYDWKMNDLTDLINTLGLANRVRLLGKINDVDLPAIYALSYVFCFPSFAEGFGIPPLEAMSSGVPVVVSDTTSLPEICGDAGTYVNPNNPKEIAAAIDKLLENKPYYEQQRERGINQSANFTWESAACQLLKACDTLSQDNYVNKIN